ncbi:MAG: LPS-assembly protein LptD, partial [Treponema sp.]|nr:LPS-assembly protein LptD [Treponema sp.]
IEMDLNTSTLPELAAWCRSLGLSEGGDVNTLKNSLRAYFKMPSPSGNAQDDKRKIITINSARTTEYFKIDAVDEDYARLTGDVQVMLKDGDTTHEFSAWDVLFNRTRNIITAKGNVEYKRTEGDKIETFRGDSITVDLDNWESIFLGGVSERSLASDNTTYLFSGTVISKDEEDVTILTKGSISGATSPDSLWSLTASRIWLLPGSDFAILNAVLKVGEIPVLYIPFFYFPADEVVFHPVIGSRNREGNFIQTTTYLLGNRSSASSVTQSSLTKILGNSNDMEKKREGLFLRSTGKKADNTSGANLSLMLDYYTNLGAFAGINLLTPKLSIFNPITFNAGLGFSRTIVLDGGNYTPFAPKYDGSSDWNKSTFLSFEVPFRYRFNFNSGITGTLGSLTWDIPYYSDPWMDSDFMNRAEDMDWVNMIQQGAALEAENTSDITMTTYTWRLSGNLNPKFPNMSPFISNISIGALSSSIGFNSKIKNISSSDPAYYSPSRAFYYPNSATLYSAGFTVTGNPLSLGGGSGTGLVNSWTPDQPKEGAPDPLAGIGVPVSPWESGKKEDQQVPKDTTTLIPPVLSQRFEPRKIGSTQVGFSYSVNPMSTSELQFDSSKWNNYNDIDWNDVESVLSSFSANANTAINFSQSDGLYSGSFTFGGNGAWRQFSYIDDKATKYVPTASDPNPAQTARIQQYKSNTFFTTNYGLNTTVSPLFLSNTWKGSNLTYSLSGLAVKSGSFIGTADAPKWKIDYGEWNKDKITTHSLTAQLAANVLDKNQSLSVSADLPPRDSRYSANAAFNVWITNTTASMQVRNVEDEKKRKLDPFNFYETLKFGNYATVNYTMILDTEKRQFTTISTTLSTASNIGLSAGYTASRISGYKLDPSSGWVASTATPSLKSTLFNLNYYKSFINNTLWNNRFNFTLSVNPRLNFDLQ